MSIQAVAWVLEHSKSRGTARLVLIALANRVGKETGECWPAMRTIAKEAGVGSTSTVHSALEKLVALEELVIVDRGTQRRSGKYLLPFAVETNDRSGQRSAAEHSTEPESNAAFGPERTQRSAQAEQNHQEPSATPERASASRSAGESFEAGFNRTWRHYPRKIARRAALRAYRARRRAGDDPAEMHLATQRFAKAMAHEGRAENVIMHGATFFGPDERWRDYLDWTPDKDMPPREWFDDG